MKQPPLSPTNDFVFKKVFGENMRILADFLMAVLTLPHDDYQGMIVVNPTLTRQTPEDKYGVLDIKIITHNQKTIDVEVQVRPQRSLWKRTQYYIAKMYAEQIKTGEEYRRLTNAIGIMITDFVLVEDDQYHHRYRLFDEKNQTQYPDSIEINILEIPKAREEDSSKLNNWMKFFAAKTEEQFMTIAEKNPAIAEAWGVIKVLSADEEARLVAESVEKARRDEADREYGAVRDHVEKIARAALRDKLPVEQIARITGLTIDEIERLASES